MIINNKVEFTGIIPRLLIKICGTNNDYLVISGQKFGVVVIIKFFIKNNSPGLYPFPFLLPPYGPAMGDKPDKIKFSDLIFSFFPN
jgi:hypothetical protein